MLPDHFDVWAATELFAASDVDALGRAWEERSIRPAAVVQGPAAAPLRGQVSSSGLALFVSGWSVVGIRRHRFARHGRRRIDADPWAAKGILWVALTHRTGARVDVSVTHLHAGGYLGDEPADAPSVRRDQVQEVVDFLEASRRHSVPLVVGGDWNIGGGPPGLVAGPDDRHLRESLATLGLVDAWDIVGEGPGYTSNCKEHPGLFVDDPDDARYCAEPAPVSPQLSRIDRCFVSTGDAVRVRSVRRRAHRRAPDAPLVDVIPTLSDHVGLDLDLDLRVPEQATSASTGITS